MTNKYSVLFLLFFIMGIFASAQHNDLEGDSKGSAEDQNTWTFKIEPNVWIPKMKGHISYANIPKVTVHSSLADVLKMSKAGGGMLGLEATNVNWTVGTSLIYVSARQDVNKGAEILSGRLSEKLFYGEVYLLRKVVPRFDAGVSLQVISVKPGLDINVYDPLNEHQYHFKKSLSKTWVDQMFVLRFSNLGHEKWLYKVTGEIGGFSGPSMMWKLEALAGYKFSDLFYMFLGYNVVSLDHESGRDLTYLRYDMNLFGPVLKLGFTIN